MMCGLDRTYVSAVDRGLRNISLVNIWKLATILEVNPSIFFVEEEEFKEMFSHL